MNHFDAVHVVYSPFPADPRVRREVLALSTAGYRVAVISQAAGEPAGESIWNDVTIFRIPGSKRRGTFGQYVLEYGGFLGRCWSLVHRDPRLRNASAIHAHSLPDFLVFAAHPARTRGARVVLDLHEILPEFAAAKFAGFASRPMRWLGLRIERASRRFADATITVNRPIQALLHARRSRPDEDIVVLHNAPDPADFGRLRDPQPRERLDVLRVVYHGTLTRVYGLDMAIDAVNTLAGKQLPVTLDIFGDGPERERLHAKVSTLGLSDRITLHAPVSAQVLRERLPTFDAGLVPTRADVMTQYSLSTKLLEYIHLGIPAVAPTLKTYLQYFGTDALHYYAANDSDALARALSTLKETPAATRACYARRAQDALREIAWEVEKPHLLALYERLGARPRLVR